MEVFQISLKASLKADRYRELKTFSSGVARENIYPFLTIPILCILEKRIINNPEWTLTL